MTPLEVVQAAVGMEMVEEDGSRLLLEMLPPLSQDEMDELVAKIPCPIPGEVRELLAFSRGFANGPLESVDFSGPFELGREDLFPHALLLAHDGFGNYWIADLTSSSKSWGPILFYCHDAPVCIYQTASLTHFIQEMLRLANPPYESELDFVHEDAVRRVWAENPDMLTVDTCRNSSDRALREFAGSLDESYLIYDMRHPSLGDGFSWGRYGPRTLVKRFGEERIFAYQGVGVTLVGKLGYAAMA
jgi:hypothetical protein